MVPSMAACWPSKHACLQYPRSVMHETLCQLLKTYYLVLGFHKFCLCMMAPHLMPQYR